MEYPVWSMHGWNSDLGYRGFLFFNSSALALSFVQESRGYRENGGKEVGACGRMLTGPIPDY